MSPSNHRTARRDRVTAVFSDHEQSFELGLGTTLEQLTDRLAELARQNYGWPVGISVVFDGSGSAQPIERLESLQPAGASTSSGGPPDPAAPVKHFR